MKERLESEPKDWTPKIYIRGHHLFDYPTIRGAFFGRELLSLNFDAPNQKENYPDDFRNYVEDTYGDTNIIADQRKISAKISELKDQDIVGVGMEKDLLCQSCPIGKHCDATNFTLFGDHIDRHKREKKKVDLLYNALMREGFEEGVDFVFEKKEYELLDYHGGNIWGGQVPTQQKVVFYNLFLKVETLRKVL